MWTASCSWQHMILAAALTHLAGHGKGDTSSNLVSIALALAEDNGLAAQCMHSQHIHQNAAPSF